MKLEVEGNTVYSSDVTCQPIFTPVSIPLSVSGIDVETFSISALHIYVQSAFIVKLSDAFDM